MVIVLTGPFVLLATALTLSVFGAIGGLPLLMLSLPSALIAIGACRRSEPIAAHKALPVTFGLFTLLLILSSVGGIVYGFDDIGGLANFGLILVAGLWCTGAAAATAALLSRSWAVRQGDSYNTPTSGPRSQG